MTSTVDIHQWAMLLWLHSGSCRCHWYSPCSALSLRASLIKMASFKLHFQFLLKISFLIMRRHLVDTVTQLPSINYTSIRNPNTEDCRSLLQTGFISTRLIGIDRVVLSLTSAVLQMAHRLYFVNVESVKFYVNVYD